MSRKVLSLNFYDTAKGTNSPRADTDYLEFCSLQYGDNGVPDLERKRMVSALKNIVRCELTDRQRDCVALRYADGQSINEIAAALGITAPTASKHLKKARARIQKIMLLSFPRLQKGGGCGVE